MDRMLRSTSRQLGERLKLRRGMQSELLRREEITLRAVVIMNNVLSCTNNKKKTYVDPEGITHFPEDISLYFK